MPVFNRRTCRGNRRPPTAWTNAQHKKADTPFGNTTRARPIHTRRGRHRCGHNTINMLSITSASSLSLPMIDMMTAHDEIPMLRYRLRLHAPLAIKTIILEGNLSHAGYPKPLHVRNSLTAEEIEKYKVEIHNVPFGPDLEQRMTSCRNGTNVKCTWILEVTQRKFIMSMLQPTIDRTLKEHGLDDILVHMSDLDELLDVDAVRNLSLIHI